MLDIIKSKLTNIATTFVKPEAMSSELLKLVEKINKYQEEDKNVTDLHRVTRIITKYSTMYKVAVEDYMAIPNDRLEDRSFQVQEILCLLSLITSAVTDILRKYNMSEDKGSIGRHLRTLTNSYEFYKNEKITWTTVLKGITTLITERITDKKMTMQKVTLQEKYLLEEKNA